MKEIIQKFEQPNATSLKSLKEHLGKVRTGRANIALLDGVMVDYYGTPTPIKQVANLSTPDARTIQVQAWEAGILPAVEKAIISETGGHLKRIFISLLQGQRNEGTQVDSLKAKEDAKRLFEAGEKQFGTDESEFNRVFATASKAHIRAVLEEYRTFSSYDLEKVVRKEMSGALEDAFVALIQNARDPCTFFAHRLQKAMAGAGTNDADLIRVIVTQSEKDMEGIKAAYVKLYGKTLAKALEGECSGDYKRMLLSLID